MHERLQHEAKLHNPSDDHTRQSRHQLTGGPGGRRRNSMQVGKTGMIRGDKKGIGCACSPEPSWLISLDGAVLKQKSPQETVKTDGGRRRSARAVTTAMQNKSCKDRIQVYLGQGYRAPQGETRMEHGRRGSSP